MQLKHIDRQLSLPGSDLQVQLRNFAQADLGAIVQNERSASLSPWSEANFRDSLGCSHICVGLVMAHSSPETWLAHAVFSLAAGEAELLILAVAPKWQGKKIATTLLLSMEDILSAHAQQIFLEVRQSNTPAIHLYESLGFHCLGERPNYYPSVDLKKSKREHAFIYAKDIGCDFGGVWTQQ